jgi:hypothetical protein
MLIRFCISVRLHCRNVIMGFSGYSWLHNARAYVRINGVEWLTAAGYPSSRGINTIELVTDDCVAINYRHFDTYANTAQSDALVSYVRGIPQSTVLIGVTADEAQRR